MKTNFDAWRDSLTPEAFYEKRKDSSVIALPCTNCPARSFCNEASDITECKDIFTAWANAPAIMTEEEKRVLCETKRKWSVVARDLRVAAKRAEFYLQMGLADIIEAQALDTLDKACVDFLRHCHEQWLACARDAVEAEEATK